MTAEKEDDGSSQYLQEACYYLTKKGLTMDQVSKALEISEQEASRLYQQFEDRIASGDAMENEIDRNLWEDVYNDSVGNEKITFVRDNGFYHCRRADLDKMDSPALMAIFETSKKFLDFDMYRRYLDSKPPVGYDPMAMQRQIKRAVDLIEQVLKQRWVSGESKGIDGESR
ncbi:MAG: hypothetical protein AUI50_07135 [Crenarchaeota archaeon 13_1_40CM_2_52_14]|nr:MAG: hypothetical protein AUI97_07735 [Crenarchaeota archaeon 13_1_40CM_3_52_17]OLD34325.1 MAG: hypothetical protein AUI50_07135 [Crenarchaeota archaeon 13_1_40CM_2_52_14]